MSEFCLACGAVLNPPEESSRPYPGSGPNRPGRILFCSGCGHGVADPLPNNEQLASYYQGEYWQVATPVVLRRRAYPVAFLLAKLRWAAIRAALMRRGQRAGISIIDIGAGQGCLGLVAASDPLLAGGRYIAVEPDPSLRASLALSWDETNVRLSQHEELDEISGSYSVVVLSHLLEHVLEPAALLTKARELIASDGLLFVDVPHADWKFKQDVFPHLSFFTPASLRQLLEASGFDLLEIGSFGDPVAWKRPAPPVKRILNKFLMQLPELLQPLAINLLYQPARHRSDGTWLRALARHRDKL